MQSPRANAPSNFTTPAGNRLAPASSAFAAPASICTVPRGSKEPAIHFLRAVTGLDGVKNHVQRPPSAMRFTGLVTRPSAITICVPPVVAMSTGVPARTCSSMSCQKSVCSPTGATLYTGVTVMIASASATFRYASSNSFSVTFGLATA